LINVDIPGKGSFSFQNLVLDLNGTIALDGKPVEGVSERLNRLKDALDIYIITADTHGTAGQLEEKLPVKILKIQAGGERSQKLDLIRQLGEKITVAIGNGSNDTSMLQASGLGICTIGKEGAASEALSSSDIVVCDINDAFEMLLNPKRIVATLRK